MLPWFSQVNWEAGGEGLTQDLVKWESAGLCGVEGAGAGTALVGGNTLGGVNTLGAEVCLGVVSTLGGCTGKGSGLVCGGIGGGGL